MKNFEIPVGYFASSDWSDSSEEAAARRRKELRDKLLRGEEIKVTPTGEVRDKSDESTSYEPAIVVPPGKLAANFYWYENDKELYREEVLAMNRYFPQFKLEKLDDGRLSWQGMLNSDLRPNARWYLQVVYDNSHPHNNSYGGSVRVYSIDPDLDDLARTFGNIPHVLRDASGEPYLCTSRTEDFRASKEHSTSAASALAWAAKWIAAFELWIAGDISSAQFSGHSI